VSNTGHQPSLNTTVNRLQYKHLIFAYFYSAKNYNQYFTDYTPDDGLNGARNMWSHWFTYKS